MLIDTMMQAGEVRRSWLNGAMYYGDTFILSDFFSEHYLRLVNQAEVQEASLKALAEFLAKAGEDDK